MCCASEVLQVAGEYKSSGDAHSPKINILCCAPLTHPCLKIMSTYRTVSLVNFNKIIAFCLKQAIEMAFFGLHSHKAIGWKSGVFYIAEGELIFKTQQAHRTKIHTRAHTGKRSNVCTESMYMHEANVLERLTDMCASAYQISGAVVPKNKPMRKWKGRKAPRFA